MLEQNLNLLQLSIVNAAVQAGRLYYAVQKSIGLLNF